MKKKYKKFLIFEMVMVMERFKEINWNYLADDTHASPLRIR